MGKRNPERLEDRLQHMLRVAALDQPHVKGEAGALGELAQEVPDEIAAQARDARVREVDIRDDERPP